MLRPLYTQKSGSNVARRLSSTVFKQKRKTFDNMKVQEMKFAQAIAVRHQPHEDLSAVTSSSDRS